MKKSVTFILLYLFSTGFALSQSVPDFEILKKFYSFESFRLEKPIDALSIADELHGQIMGLDSENTYASPQYKVDVIVQFAEFAIEQNRPEKALFYLTSIEELLVNELGQTTLVYELFDQVYLQLNKPKRALEYGLKAYNAAEARLGPESRELLERLDLLEPRIQRLIPQHLEYVSSLRAKILNPDGTAGDALDSDARGDTGIKPHSLVVHYGTNRKSTGFSDPTKFFGKESGELLVGKLTVTIPPNHLSGKIEKPDNWFYNQRYDPQSHIVLAKIEELNREAFAKDCCGANDRLLFVHGYNVSFHDGALRAAQLSFDLEFKGKTLYYSWPSNGTLLGYFSDGDKVNLSIPSIVDYLELVTKGSGKLHIIVHSMGNRYILDGLESFFAKYPERRIGQVVFAAPDVDKSKFENQIINIADKADRLTLYTSKNDLALLVSKQVNGQPRAGNSSDELPIVGDIDSIDASNIETDNLGHSYFGQAPQVLGDLLGTIRLNHSPSIRCGLAVSLEVSDSLRTWKVLPEGCPVEQIRTASDMVDLYGESALVEVGNRLEMSADSEVEFWNGVMDSVRNITGTTTE